MKLEELESLASEMSMENILIGPDDVILSMEDEWRLLTDYNKKNKDMQSQIEDLQQVVERLKAPQDYTAIMQRLQSDNDWLKERVVNLEKELAEQRERAHFIISELTTQLSEQRKLLENLRQNEERSKKGFWKR